MPPRILLLGHTQASASAATTLPNETSAPSSHSFCRTLFPSYQTELSHAILVSQYYSKMEIGNIKFIRYINFLTSKKGNPKDRPAQQNKQSGTLEEH